MPGRGRTAGRDPIGRRTAPNVKRIGRMNHPPRLRALEDRHAVLEREISQEDARPKPDNTALGRLKREKLKLREEIERLRKPEC
jgi:hypothetical protein